MRPVIEKELIERELQDYLILEGSQTNPYPYIKQATLYVQPSYYEAYSTTVTEAKILAKPIVVTDVGGMRDQLEDTVNGMIVPISADGIANAVFLLMASPEIMDQFSRKLSRERFECEYYLKDYNRTVFGEA